MAKAAALLMLLAPPSSSSDDSGGGGGGDGGGDVAALLAKGLCERSVTVRGETVAVPLTVEQVNTFRCIYYCGFLLCACSFS